MPQNAHVARLMTIWLADDPFPWLVPSVKWRPDWSMGHMFFNKEKMQFRETYLRKHVCRVCGGGGLCHLPSAATQGPVIARARSPLNYAYFEKHLIDHPELNRVAGPWDHPLLTFLLHFHSVQFQNGILTKSESFIFSAGHQVWVVMMA